MSETMQSLRDSSALDGESSAYVEALYEQYLQDPQTIPEDWQVYFTSLKELTNGALEISHAAVREQFKQLAKQPRQVAAAPADAHIEKERKQAQVWRLVTAYRRIGHQRAVLDPLALTERPQTPDLDPGFYGLSPADLDLQFAVGDFLGARGHIKLRELIGMLDKAYCSHVGIEYMHITNHAETAWLQQRIESTQATPHFDRETKQRILHQLIAAEGLEKYLATKYVGQKRFGLEGAESLIAALDELVMRAGAAGIKEVVLGMAHRGRLNVLVNVLGKSPAELFDEFEGKASAYGSGDVKYHQGFSSGIETAGGRLHLALAFNPSHLEIIDPVVEGSVRARQDRRQDKARNLVLPVLLHGDAAFAGQGVVMETFALSQARGYRTGGTVHIIVNNQIGFTTSNPLDARSSLYCTDVAKMVQAPVIHVNGDDPEAVVFAMQLALDYRMKFKKDVVLDIVCYRRHGHNEADEPSITQPIMYQAIKKQKTVTQTYIDKLVSEATISAEQATAKIEEYRKNLDERRSVRDTIPGAGRELSAFDWAPYLGHDLNTTIQTAVNKKQLQALHQQLMKLPEGFVLQPQVAREMQTREEMLAGKIPLNWGCAETLAYASLLAENYNVRLSGQDCGRGTFSHRHAMLHNQARRGAYIPLQNLAQGKGRFTVIDSVLSEAAVLGFEYGYATADPTALVIWEAQFGDFANGAQVVVDQFLSSGEQKWGRLCGLVMLLPHGYEGQGPEHSSARLERYLQLCAQHNMQVCVPSTPAQIFHLLRRQLLRPVRKPLIVMTPKSLLRHKLATSPLADLASGEFQLLIPEIDKLDKKQVTRVVVCSGKVYYELLEARRSEERNDVAIIRIEQLYPFPDKELKQKLAFYTQAEHVIWCQEEPMNQGAWYSTQHHLHSCLAKWQSLTYAGREHFASPAGGIVQVHKEQQLRLVKSALG